MANNVFKSAWDDENYRKFVYAFKPTKRGKRKDPEKTK